MNIFRELRISRAIEAGDFQKAIAEYEAELVKRPADLYTLELLAQCHFWNDEPQKSIDTIRRREQLEVLDFGMLSLSVKCLKELEDHKSGYIYACRCMKTPPSAAIEVPKLLNNIPGISGATLRVSQDEWRDLGWVKKYKEWCDCLLYTSPSPRDS